MTRYTTAVVALTLLTVARSDHTVAFAFGAMLTGTRGYRLTLPQSLLYNRASFARISCRPRDCLRRVT